jgi:hypothetical protein
MALLIFGRPLEFGAEGLDLRYMGPHVAIDNLLMMPAYSSPRLHAHYETNSGPGTFMQRR